MCVIERPLPSPRTISSGPSYSEWNTKLLKSIVTWGGVPESTSQEELLIGHGVVRLAVARTGQR